MAASTADTLCQSGMAYPTAIEIAKQMAAGSGGVNASSINKLIASGVPGSTATVLVAQISANSFNADALAKAGFHPGVAVQIKNTSGH